MSLLTINDVGIISGPIVMPKIGVWAADLVIDQADASGFDAGTSVTIKGDDLSIVGVVVPDRTGDFLDAVHVRVVGGKNGLGKQATPRSFMGPGVFVGDVLNGLMSDSGETLSNTIDQQFLKTQLAAWSTMGQSVSWNLRALLRFVAPTFSWRILDDGTLWMGDESWSSASGTFDIIKEHPADNRFELGVESPFILPGSSLDGIGNVNRVEHQISRDRIRSIVSVDLPEGDRGIQGSIARMVTSQLAGFDYFALYPCKVVSQSADLTTVDISFDAPTNQKIAGLQRVNVRAGDGFKIQFNQNASVLLGWEGGDPRAPFVGYGKSADNAQLIQLNGGTLKSARVTDPLAVGTLTGQAGPYPVIFTLVPTVSVGGVDTPGVPATGPSVNLGGIISNSGGASGVKA